MLKNLKISVRLGISFGCILIIFIGFGLMALWEMNHLAGQSENLYEHSFKVSNAILKIDRDMEKMHGAMEKMTPANDPADIAATEKIIKTLETKFDKNLTILDTQLTGD